MKDLWWQIRRKFQFNRYYYRLVSFGLLVLVIPIALVSFITYKGTLASMEEEVIRSYNDILRQVQQRVDERLSLVDQSMNPLLLDSNLLKLVHMNDFPDGLVMRRIQTELNQLSQSISRVDSVTLHIPKHNIILTDSRYINEESISYSSEIPSPVANGKWQYQDEDAYRVITLTHNLPVFDSEPKAFLSFHFRRDAFKDILESVEFLSEGKLMLVNANHQEIYSYGDRKISQTQLNQGLEAIIYNRTDDRYLTQQEFDSSILYVESEKTGWYSVLFIPSETLNPYKEETIWMTIIIALIAISVGSIIILMRSRKLYEPINQWLIEENYTNDSTRRNGDEWNWLRNKWLALRDNYNKSIPLLRKNFLLGLLIGEYEKVSHKQLQHLFVEKGIDQNQQCIVLIVQPNRLEINKYYQKGEEYLVYMGINEVVDDILKQYHVEGDILQQQENQHTICILYFSKMTEKEQVKRLLYQLSQTIKMTFKNYYKVTATIALGSLRATTYEIRESYLEARKSMQYKILYSEEDILDVERIEYTHESKKYPIDLSEQIIKAMKDLNKEKTEKLFISFVDTIAEKKYDDTTVRQMFLMLYDTILYSFNDFSEEVVNEFINFDMFEKIQHAESRKEIEEYFLLEWFPYCFKWLKHENESKGTRLIETVEEYILSTIDQDHSLRTVAEKVGLNPSYFSRLFRKQSGENFVQFVASLKVKKAMELLAETDETIKTVAEKVGYTEQTLRRVFKNETGMTPSQYRKSKR